MKGKLVERTQVEKELDRETEIPKESFYSRGTRRTEVEMKYDVLLSTKKFSNITRIYYATGMNQVCLKKLLSEMRDSELVEFEGRKIKLTKKGEKAIELGNEFFEVMGVYE